jgi:hypothetical protein
MEQLLNREYKSRQILRLAIRLTGSHIDPRRYDSVGRTDSTLWAQSRSGEIPIVANLLRSFARLAAVHCPAKLERWLLCPILTMLRMKEDVSPAPKGERE